MDWKSTAVISGAGILATWLFSMPAAHSPTAPLTRPATPAGTVRPADSSIDIQAEAARLQERPQPESPYAEPARNPFRFGDRRGNSRPRSAERATIAAAPETAVPALPPQPRLVLEGIATDVVGGIEQRTAILNTPTGVVLAREGEDVAGLRVGKVAADAVDLIASDGSVLHIALR